MQNYYQFLFLSKRYSLINTIWIFVAYLCNITERRDATKTEP